MNRNELGVSALCQVVVLVAAVAGAAAPPKGGASMTTLTIESSAFAHKQPIPALYTCDGQGISPPLSWKGIPQSAKSLVLMSDDPDAPVGTWVHWVVYDIPPTVTGLEQSQPKTDTLPCGARQGITDFKCVGYGGPCPPSGTHRYFFKLYALDVMLGLPAGKSKKDVEKAMAGHVVAQGEIVGVYCRKK
jgi:hypothetical protein